MSGSVSATTREGVAGGDVLRWFGRRVKEREMGIFVVAVAMLVYFQFANSAFLSARNLTTLSQSMAPTMIMALGLVMVLILGEIDLSVGSMFGFAPAIMWIAYEEFLLVLPVAVAVGLVAALAVGWLNGAIRVYFGVPSFVVTLGTFFLLGGLTVILLGGFPKTPPAGVTQLVLGNYAYAHIIWALAILVVMHFLLKNSRWGLHTSSTGGNLIGAREAGVRVDRIRIVNFMISALLAGLAGIMESMRVSSISPDAGGANTMFLAISAAVIGGTPLAGGIGTMIGAALGALVLSELRQGFTLLGVSANTFNVILGIAILVLMIFNLYVGTMRSGPIGRPGARRAG